jgi:hypothetical protein
MENHGDHPQKKGPLEYLHFIFDKFTAALLYRRRSWQLSLQIDTPTVGRSTRRNFWR